VDDHLALFHALTFGNRLRRRWYRWKQRLAAASYVTKLFMLTYQNILVLRHFRRCRAVEPSQKGRPPRLRYVAFYKETFRQSLQLFSPLRSSRQSATEECRRENVQRSAVVTQVPAVGSGPEEHATTLLRATRGKGWRRIPAWLLWLRQSPYYLMWRWKGFRQGRQFKAKVRILQRQEQATFLRDQHQLTTSAQAALFLSLVNIIDLKTTQELTVLCQHLSKKRQRRRMTAEDLSCFDKTLSDIDNNYETLLATVQ